MPSYPPPEIPWSGICRIRDDVQNSIRMDGGDELSVGALQTHILHEADQWARVCASWLAQGHDAGAALAAQRNQQLLDEADRIRATADLSSSVAAMMQDDAPR